MFTLCTNAFLFIEVFRIHVDEILVIHELISLYKVVLRVNPVMVYLLHEHVQDIHVVILINRIELICPVTI